MLTAGQWTFVKTQCLNVGPQGPTGPTGPIGPAGPAGDDGTNYYSGPNGQSGPSGCSGPAGPNGADGKNAPDRTTELSSPRTRSYGITDPATIPIYLNDTYQTILLNPTESSTITLNPSEIQTAGSVSNFWVMLKNTSSTYSITVNTITLLGTLGSQDIFIRDTRISPITIPYLPVHPSVILYYDNTGIFGHGNGRFVLI